MALTFICLTSSNPIMLYLAAVLFGLGNGVMWPSFLTILSQVGDPNKQGSLQGIANSFGSLASILGLVFGGFLLALLSERLYFLSAALLVVIVLISVVYLRRVKPTKSV